MTDQPNETPAEDLSDYWAPDPPIGCLLPATAPPDGLSARDSGQETADGGEAGRDAARGADGLQRYRAWLAEQQANAERADQSWTCPPELRISPHNGIAAGLATALFGFDHLLAGHDGGPSVREAAADDRRWWNGEKTGE